jgi:hypothetical protein
MKEKCRLLGRKEGLDAGYETLPPDEAWTLAVTGEQEALVLEDSSDDGDEDLAVEVPDGTELWVPRKKRST